MLFIFFKVIFLKISIVFWQEKIIELLKFIMVLYSLAPLINNNLILLNL